MKYNKLIVLLPISDQKVGIIKKIVGIRDKNFLICWDFRIMSEFAEYKKIFIFIIRTIKRYQIIDG